MALIETKSKMFDKYKERYDRGGCTEDQLRRLVELRAITAKEFSEITGKDYA